MTSGEIPKAETETEDPAVDLARRLAERGLLEPASGHWRLTPTGLPLADGVAAEFLGAESWAPQPSPHIGRSL